MQLLPVGRWGTLLVVVSVLSTACSGGSIREVPLAQLAAEQDAYDGQAVRTLGTVVSVVDQPGDEPYFVLQDAAGNRVRLLPDGAVRGHEGDVVTVTGTFAFRPDAGRELLVDEIRADDVQFAPTSGAVRTGREVVQETTMTRPAGHDGRRIDDEVTLLDRDGEPVEAARCGTELVFAPAVAA